MLAPTDSSVRFRAAAVAAVVATGVAIWAYWPTLIEMAWRWGHDPQYSHGYLVPAFALYLLWAQRVEVNPVALYRGEKTSRRSRRAPPPPVETPASDKAVAR